MKVRYVAGQVMFVPAVLRPPAEAETCGMHPSEPFIGVAGRSLEAYSVPGMSPNLAFHCLGSAKLRAEVFFWGGEGTQNLQPQAGPADERAGQVFEPVSPTGFSNVAGLHRDPGRAAENVEQDPDPVSGLDTFNRAQEIRERTSPDADRVSHGQVA